MHVKVEPREYDRAVSETRFVTSRDGTRIGREVFGDGPPLLIVHGAMADRTQWAPVRDALAKRFTVHLMDRRGRGLSADEPPDYAPEREAEDLVAVIDDIGEPPFVLAHANGGLNMLDAMLLGAKVRMLLLDDVVAGRPGAPIQPPGLCESMQEALNAGDRDKALEIFLLALTPMDKTAIDGLRDTAVWEARRASVHTYPREGSFSNTYGPDPERLAQIQIPVRLVVGDASPEQIRRAMFALAEDMPQAELVEVEGRLFTTMYSDPDTVVRHIEDFFLDSQPRKERPDA